MSKNSIDTDYRRNCPICNKELFYSKTSSLNLANRENKVCRSCVKNGIKLPKNHDEIVKRICEKCGKSFEVIWKYRKQRFCSSTCMQKWRTDTAWTTSNCLHCGNEFKHRIKYNKEYCSDSCRNNSVISREKKRQWGKSDKNHWYTEKSQNAAKQTKLEKYGDVNYNNPKKSKETNIQRYGVACSFFIPGNLSNGKRISNGQRKLYETLLQTYPDVILEHYLEDVDKSVDIFIPSQNKIIEYFGDYWHCNPKKYDSEYYHKNCKLTAKDIWKRDSERIELFENNGYNVQIVWESSATLY